MDELTKETFDPATFKLEDAAGLDFLVKNHLFGKETGKMRLEDALSTPNAAPLFKKVISNIVREAQEPLLVGTSLLQRIEWDYGQRISFPAVGALVAADIGEGMEYPERSPDITGGTVEANIGKSGIAVRLTEEMIRWSQFDVIGMMLRAAGRALARHKEEKIFNYITTMGVTVFDNLTPTHSEVGVTTGRDAYGAANGSLTMDDLFDCYAHILHQGFIPNTLLMHPLMWAAFIKDSTLRSFALANGGGSFFGGWTGSPNQQYAPNANGGLGIGAGQNITAGGIGNTAGAASGSAVTAASGYPQTMTSAPVLPSYFSVPFRIIVSHFMPFDARTKLTDIYMFDSNELGALIVAEDVTVDEFEDPARDMRKIKLKERYGIGILNEGQAIGTINNIRAIPNQTTLPAQVTLAQSGQVNPIGSTDSVLA